VAAQPKVFLFEGSGNPEGKGFDGRYSQRGVQWAVKTVARQAGVIKDVHTHMLRHPA
jgi:site-specific recombinase XerC